MRQAAEFPPVRRVARPLAPGLHRSQWRQAKDIDPNGNEGIGKPVPLKHGFHGYWSRRSGDEHRLVYKISESEIRIAACRYHYET